MSVRESYAADVQIGEVTHLITMRVRGLKGWKVRLAMARLVFRFGGWIAGVNLVIEA